MIDPTTIDFTKGLVPAIVRDARGGTILMLAFMSEEALRKTLDSGETWFWSRSRNALWHKGATSGNRQKVVAISTDCDRDTLLVDVEPEGPACHTGSVSCFGEPPTRAAEAAAAPLTDRSDLLDLSALMSLLRDRMAKRPEGSYSSYLFNSGTDKILKKVGEESTEVIIAAKGQGGERLTSEIADLLFHLSVLLVDQKLDWRAVAEELEKRAK
jgi:phosphoribosyl-ATP pyrophosphohydrolase/phosphoribosyl-AMP cyclohydrolase